MKITSILNLPEGYKELKSEQELDLLSKQFTDIFNVSFVFIDTLKRSINILFPVKIKKQYSENIALEHHSLIKDWIKTLIMNPDNDILKSKNKGYQYYCLNISLTDGEINFNVNIFPTSTPELIGKGTIDSPYFNKFEFVISHLDRME